MNMRQMPLRVLRPLALYGLCSGALYGCLTPAAARAERDETVGSAVGDGLEVHTDDGLAAVLSLNSDEIRLWQSAPSIAFSLTVPGEAVVALELHNVMPGSDLRILPTENTNQKITIDSEDSSLVTRRRYQIRFPDEGQYRFEHGTTDARERTPFRFALMSDVQEAIDEVQDIYAKLNRESGLDFLLGAGDLTQQGTHEQLMRFKAELTALTVPYYTTLGNHELGERPPPYQELFGRGSFSFEHKGARFTLLDSASAMIDTRVFEWLEGWLDAGRNSLHLVAMHVPPVDPIGVRNGSFASRTEANKLLARLLSGGVDLTLYGHVHSFYSFENASIPALISGGGGAIPERFDGIGRHYLVIDVDPEEQSWSHQVARVD